MKPVKWIVLISLLLLLLVLGAFLLHPLGRFSINLYLDRFDRAESVYLSGPLRGRRGAGSPAALWI